jgi:hydroxyacyl-ACP dehydratase HTD2-like protein with hotdog domain
MLVLLDEVDEVKEVSKAKPMMWVNLGGIWKKKRLRIVLSMVSGDQKLQDFHCHRKVINNGSASSIHHGCMALAVNSTAVGPDGALHGGCQKPWIQVLNRLNGLALMDVSDNTNSGPMALVQQLLLAESTKQWKEKHAVVQHICRVKILSKNILGKVFSMHAH